MNLPDTPEIAHASAVAIDGRAVLIFGPSGSGKSDLALRLIATGARLIGDDGAWVRRDGARAVALPPPQIAGLMEVRGIGIVQVPDAATSDEGFPVALAVELVSTPDEIERMPESHTREIAGVPVPCVRLWGFAASAAAVVGVALDLAIGRRKPGS